MGAFESYVPDEPNLSRVGEVNPERDTKEDISFLDPSHPSGVASDSPDLVQDESVNNSRSDEDGSASDMISPLEDSVVVALQGLEAQVQAFHIRAENYEQIVRNMQNRIERLQGDQVQALLKPVIQRLAGLHAQAAEAAVRARDLGESAEKDFSFFAVAIEEALGLVDIESVKAAPDVEFNSKKHHAVRAVPTGDIDRDRRVQRVLRQGFTYVDAPRVFLPAQVSVYRYESLQPVTAGDTSKNNPNNNINEGDLGE